MDPNMYPVTPPSLLELCIQCVIHNVRYLRDVGDVEERLLARILPHCNAEQLAVIEDCSEGVDLTPITNHLWKKIYELKFGADSTNHLAGHQTIKWRNTYEDKLAELQIAEELMGQRLRQRYAEDQARKESRQIMTCSKKPPTGKKSFFSSGSRSSQATSYKSPIMRKAKLEFLNSSAAKNHQISRKICTQTKNSGMTNHNISRKISAPAKNSGVTIQHGSQKIWASTKNSPSLASSSRLSISIGSAGKMSTPVGSAVGSKRPLPPPPPQVNGRPVQKKLQPSFR